METYDRIRGAKVNLVDIGGKTLPVLAPATAWAVGTLVALPIFLLILAAVLGWSLVTIFIAAAAAAMVGKWVGRETGGDHRIVDLFMTGVAEARAIKRRYQAKRGHR